MRISKGFYNLARKALDVYFATYWNFKWRRSNIYYNARAAGNIPIRSILDDDFNIKLPYTQMHNDDKVRAVLRWTNRNIRYKGDYFISKKAEFWQYASETYYSKVGDCEDGSSLMYKLLRNLGVPSFRLKICAGYVIAPNSTGDVTGHAYLIYLSEIHNAWFIVDWCYYYWESLDSLYIMPHRKLDYYKRIWWTFNEDFMWSQHEMVL